MIVAALFAGLAALAFWGLSRAHFVGADGDGRVAVYQGVPWDLGGGVKLYREVYVSRLLAEQLTPEERRGLFDHSLVSESDARARIAQIRARGDAGLDRCRVDLVGPGLGRPGRLLARRTV